MHLQHLKPKTFRARQTDKPPWLDAEYKHERCVRRRLERQWKLHNTVDAHYRYVRQRDYCVVLANTKQREFYSNLIASSINQSRLFKTVSSLWNKKGTKILPDTFKSSLDLANSFNAFFKSKVQNIRKELGPVETAQICIEPPSDSSKFVNFRTVTMEKLKEVLSGMDIKTSFDDPVPANVLESTLDTILPSILQLVNLSLTTGDINGLKESVISPILKNLKLDRNILANYRPIMNLQFLSKLIEKIVLEQLNEHMSLNNLHCPQQFAYKKHHSTENMLLQIVDDVLIGFEKNSGTILVLLDMSAAFDTVDIKKLLSILEHKIGIQGTVLKWFSSFLLDRKQKVVIDGVLSEQLVTLYGVPQGSVLGPVLFNIYISSLPYVMNHHGFSSSLYADDSSARKQFALNFQYHNLIMNVPKLIHQISAWMNEHFLKINPNKTELILFCPPTVKNTPLIQGTFIGNKCVRFSKTVKLLGVHLDSSLNLDHHVDNLVSECFYHLKNISKIRRYMTNNDAEKLIHAFVSSKIDYCNALLYGIRCADAAKLQRVQNYAARLVCSNNQISSEARLEQVHWLDIRKRIVFKLLLLVHKFFIGQSPDYMNELLLTKNEDERLLHVQYMRTVSGRKSFSYASPRIWNRLPKMVRLCDNTTRFKGLLKTVLFSNQNNIMQAVQMYYT